MREVTPGQWELVRRRLIEEDVHLTPAVWAALKRLAEGKWSVARTPFEYPPVGEHVVFAALVSGRARDKVPPPRRLPGRVDFDACPSCKGPNLSNNSGCVTCMDCAWSVCK